MLRRLPLALAVLVAAWLVASVVLFLRPSAESGAPARASAVVVLSGERNRLPRALELIRSGVAPLLAISSVSHTPTWKLALDLCARGRYEKARVLCFEASPYSTRGEAEAIARLAAARGWRSVVVVTSRFHVMRAHMLIRRCYRGPLSMVGVGSTWWHLPLDWVSETGKLLVQLTVERGC